MNQEEKIAKANGIESKWDALRKGQGCTYEDMARFAMNAIPALVVIMKEPDSKPEEVIVEEKPEGDLDQGGIPMYFGKKKK